MTTLHRSLRRGAASLSPLVVLALPMLTACKGCAGETNIVTNKADTGQEVKPFMNDWGQWLSGGVMADGSPALAWYDNTKGAAGFSIGAIAEDDTVTWTHEQADGYVNDQGLDVGNRGKYMSMGINEGGEVWLAYQDLDNKALRYANRATDGTWTSGVAASGTGSSPDAGRFASLALDASGFPVVAYHDEGKGQLGVARWLGAAFQAEVVDVGEDVEADTGTEAKGADVGEYARLVIADGVEYIAYYDAAAGDLKLAWGTAGNYEITVVDGDEGSDVGQWPSILVDGDTLRIAYHDVGNQHLKVATGTPGSWNIQIVDEGKYVGADTEIFEGPGGLNVLYFDGQGNDLKRAVEGTSGWTTETLTGAEQARGFHNEVIETGGAFWAACYDYTERNVWFSKLD